MPEIQPLKAVSLREAWPDEARDFTPWLADNIDLLGAKLDLKLEEVEAEVTLPGAGRVDICAKQAGTDAKVVIENQLGESDDSHCLRLLGYAANAEANILVWVARAFTSYHKSILEWLNDADTIHVYAVTVQAYRVGGALAADFQTVVEPQVANGSIRSAQRTRTHSTRSSTSRWWLGCASEESAGGKRRMAGPVAVVPDRTPRCRLWDGVIRGTGPGVPEFPRAQPPRKVPCPAPVPGGDRWESERDHRVA